MSLPQNITDDLAVLDTDLATTITATGAAEQATAAKQAAITAEAAALADKQKALDAQAAQLAKVKQDLDATYGVPTLPPAPAPTT